MDVYPEKKDGTHDAVYRVFFRGIPPSTEKILQSFLKYISRIVNNTLIWLQLNFWLSFKVWDSIVYKDWLYMQCIILPFSMMLKRLHNTVNVVIFAGGKFRENIGKTFHVGVIFTILLLFPS